MAKKGAARKSFWSRAGAWLWQSLKSVGSFFGWAGRSLGLTASVPQVTQVTAPRVDSRSSQTSRLIRSARNQGSLAGLSKNLGSLRRETQRLKKRSVRRKSHSSRRKSDARKNLNRRSLPDIPEETGAVHRNNTTKTPDKKPNMILRALKAIFRRQQRPQRAQRKAEIIQKQTEQMLNKASENLDDLNQAMEDLSVRLETGKPTVQQININDLTNSSPQISENIAVLEQAQRLMTEPDKPSLAKQDVDSTELKPKAKKLKRKKNNIFTKLTTFMRSKKESPKKLTGSQSKKKSPK